MTLDDDARTWATEIDRCLDEAGNNLHAEPPEGMAYPTAASARAQYFMLRVQFLERVGPERGARYIREEVLAAMQRNAEDMEATKPLWARKGVRAVSGLAPGVVAPPSLGWSATGPAGHDQIVYEHLVRAFESAARDAEMRYRMPPSLR